MAVAIHIMNELRPSGMEKMLESSFQSWQEHGWEIVIVGSGAQHPFAQSLQRLGYRVIIIPRIKSLSGILELVKIIRQNKSDIIHNHSESFHGFIALISWFASRKTPIVRTIHNCFQFGGIVKQKRKIQHLLETLVGVVRVSPSRDVQLNERNNYNVSSHLIENWIDYNKIDQVALKNKVMSRNKNLLVSMVGNCNLIKDHPFALEVISNFNEIEVFHVGELSRATNKELSILSNLNHDGKLLHNGPSDRVLEIFAQSDLHIISSLHEGMPLVIAESVVLGIETWIRDAPGVQWARHLPGVRFFATQTELRLMLSQKLKTNFALSRISHFRTEEAKRFSPSRGIQQYTSLYNSLISKNVKES